MERSPLNGIQRTAIWVYSNERKVDSSLRNGRPYVIQNERGPAVRISAPGEIATDGQEGTGSSEMERHGVYGEREGVPGETDLSQAADDDL